MPLELGIFLIVGLIVWFAIYSHQGERRKLRALQLSDIDNMTGHQFEHYVAKLLAHQGFSTQVTVASGDFGVDVIASKATTKYAIQVKRQSQNVSRRAVSDAVTGKIHYKCTDSMVVTNAFFTAGALELAKTTRCRLVDRTELTQWILLFQNDGHGYSMPDKPRPSLNDTSATSIPPVPNPTLTHEKESLPLIGDEYFLRNPGPIVYMLQHGNRAEYKIGYSKDINTRLNKVDLLLPEKIYVVHKIYTNDPRWLEEIWHKRFAGKRKNGEWFDLSESDVADFAASSRIDNPDITNSSQLVLSLENQTSYTEESPVVLPSKRLKNEPLDFLLEIEEAVERVKTHFEALKVQHPELARKLEKACIYQTSLIKKDITLWQTQGRSHEEYLANWERAAKRSGEAKIPKDSSRS